jgi:Co/Zn/Cd efflux system component
MRVAAGITASAMVIELAAGCVFGSMALLADGFRSAGPAGGGDGGG